LDTAPIDSGQNAVKLESSNPGSKRQAWVIGVTLALVFLALALRFPDLCERFNHAFLDRQLSLLPAREQAPKPVIVQVDEKSLALYGQWPWPRYQIAKLLEVIKKSGALAVGVDAIFVEKDRTSPVQLNQVITRDFQSRFPIQQIDEQYRDFDKIFGETLASGPYVLGYIFTTEPQAKNECLPESASGAFLKQNQHKDENQVPYEFSGISCNIPELQTNTRFNGFINATPDNDGLFRKSPLVIAFRGRYYPSLALQTYFTAQKINSFVLADSGTGLILRAKDLTIPLDETGNLLVKFPMRENAFDKLSAADLLSEEKLPNLQGRTVLVGFSASGLHEVRPTPYAPQFLGVELHASILANLANRDFLNRPARAIYFEIFSGVLIATSLLLLLANASPVLTVCLPLVIVTILLLGSQLLMQHTGIVISPALPLLMTLLAFIVLAFLKYRNEYLRAKTMSALVTRTQEGIIGSFCSMSEYRDPETGAHIKRTQHYVKALAVQLRNHPKFKSQLNSEIITLLFKAAPLHDIGKIGIRDHILLKNGRLMADEFAIMKTHPQIGADIIKSVAAQIGWNPFMRLSYEISLCHQEKWDGSGYPQGLSGTAIPLSARFMALADVYDALISKRVYKPAFPHAKAVRMIKEGKNNHFDPDIVEAFEAIHQQFLDIAIAHLDHEEQRETLLGQDDLGN
jgi:adenylate cyclase